MASIDGVELLADWRDQRRVRFNGKRPTGSKLCGSYVIIIMMMMTAKKKEKKQRQAFPLAAQKLHIYVRTTFVCLWTPPAVLVTTVTVLTASNTTQVYFD